jgi:hypothetical protein
MTVLLVALPILLGIAFTWLAIWARKKNSELNAGRERAQYRDFLEALRSRNFHQASLLYFTGGLPAPIARPGKFLAFVVVVAVGTFAFWFIYRLSHL